MSNYARVIVCWSGTDSMGLPDEREIQRAEIDRRAQAILACQDIGMHPRLHATVHGCGASVERDFCCEVAIVFSFNHFSIDELVALLATMKWEAPEEVEVLWKDEHADGYEKRSLPFVVLQTFTPTDPASARYQRSLGLLTARGEMVVMRQEADAPSGPWRTVVDGVDPR